jgi:hypothetical protein
MVPENAMVKLGLSYLMRCFLIRALVWKLNLYVFCTLNVWQFWSVTLREEHRLRLYGTIVLMTDLTLKQYSDDEENYVMETSIISTHHVIWQLITS